MEEITMTDLSNREFSQYVSKNLFWFGIINLLVAGKLLLSNFIPGLKTPGELLISGVLLLIYSGKMWHLRSQIGASENES